MINDAEALNEIQALHPELDVFIALEDPMSWLLLAYIKEELADYLRYSAKVYPLSYRGRDWFDWSLATRVSKRTEVAFTPFADLKKKVRLGWQSFYSVPENQQLDTIFTILQAVWTKGKIYLSRSISTVTAATGY